MAFSTIGFEGANLGVALTVSTSTPEYPGVPVTLGQKVIGTDGSEYLFVQIASGKASTVGDFMIVTNHATGVWTVDQLTSTTGKTKLGSRLGIAMATGTTLQYIWIQTSGYNAAANITTGVVANVALHSSATAGRIGSASVGGTSIAVSGVVALATSASNTAAVFMTGASVGADD